MVAEQHEIPRHVVQIDAAGRIRNQEGFDPDSAHQADRHGHLLHRVAFVEMKASLHTDQTFSLKATVDELSRVPRHRRDGESLNLFVWKAPLNLDAVIGEEAESGPEDQSNLRLEFCYFLWNIHAQLNRSIIKEARSGLSVENSTAPYNRSLAAAQLSSSL